MPLLEPVLRALLLLAVAAVVVIGVMYLMQRNLLYYPSAMPPADDILPPGAVALDLRTADGLTLGAWFLPAALASGAPASGPGPAVLIFNGNAGDRSHRLDLGLALVERGYAVLLFDYRGYAGNPGSPSETGLRADARAAVDALAARPEVDAAHIAYFGESLGAAVAGGLATERPPAALILRSPPPSIAEMARHHYPYLPVVDALLLDHFRLAEQLRAVEVPTLVLVTENDEIVPSFLSRRVFEAAAGPKSYVALTGAHHNDPALFAGDELVGEIDAFLGEWLGPS
jgi:fermentation-respiration switch protein FrsA (DUF1100 family)